jgi:hypothetical protein
MERVHLTGLDDTEWTDDWRYVPIAQVPPGVHSSGYRVERRVLHYATVFGDPYRLSVPFECRLLFDPDGRLWMSDTPQERIMMCNNARHTWGKVLVGGLGLGLYPQYAAIGIVGGATRFTIIEQSVPVQEVVQPTVEAALSVPLEVSTGDIQTYLAGPVSTRYDTIFLDTWATLDAAQLPAINRLRDLAVRHLSPEGRVLLWGYRWMVRLFEDACRQLLSVAPSQRREWLAAQAEASPQAAALLAGVASHFEGKAVADVESALGWCRQHIEGLID